MMSDVPVGIIQASAAARRLSVLITIYNEAGTIEEVVRRVRALGDLLHEIIIVDDGSKDGTAGVVERLARDEPLIKFFPQERNQGKTAAISVALANASGPVIIFQDADFEYDPEEIPEVVRPILEGQADVVFGSRFLVRRAARVLYFYHFLANKFLTFFSDVLTNRNMTDIRRVTKHSAGVIVA